MKDFEIKYYKQKQNTVIMNSTFLNLNLNDLLKGIVVAVLTVVVGSLTPLLSAGSLPTWAEFVGVLKAAGIAGVAYLLKNLLSGVSGSFLSKK